MSQSRPLRKSLGEVLRAAAQHGAATVLYLVGRPPVWRIGRELQPPLDSHPLTFHDTQALVAQLLSPAERQWLDERGNVETSFEVEGVRGHLTVFYGMGAHNLVFYLSGEESETRGANPAAGASPAAGIPSPDSSDHHPSS